MSMDDPGATTASPGGAATPLADVQAVELLHAAAKLVISSQHGSIAMLRRQFRLGHARAAWLMDQLHEHAIVGPAAGSKARAVLVPASADAAALLASADAAALLANRHSKQPDAGDPATGIGEAIYQDTATATRAAGRFRRAVVPSRWTLWTQQPSLIAYCLIIEVVALAATTLTGLIVPVRARDLAMFAGLTVMGIAQAELGRQVERMRRRINDTPHINMTSVWTFAGVLLLPPALVAVLVAVLYGHLAARSWYRLRRVPPFRTIFNGSLVVLTCYSACSVLALSGVHDIRAARHLGWVGAGAIAGAVLVYFGVAAVIAIPGMNPGNRPLRELLGGWVENLLEFATLCLGIFTALALVTMPALAVVVLPPLFLLHRGVLVKQLEIAASTDEKTGLFNTAGWHRVAGEVLGKAQQRTGVTLGVLMVDLDHFKRINDTHGHLAGDAVLKAVAEIIKANVREYDSVGRFGGEEFVVLLTEITDAQTRIVAERIRHAIERVRIPITVAGQPTEIRGLSASIGVAIYPSAGTGLDTLLHAADTAMYLAKELGRNKVVVSLADTA